MLSAAKVKYRAADGQGYPHAGGADGIYRYTRS